MERLAPQESRFSMLNADMCIVQMDDDVTQSLDFIALLARDDGDLSMYYHTDALTLGMSLKLITSAFINEMSKLDKEEKKMIVDILGDEFILEKAMADKQISDENIAERMNADE